ncbi:hypothetical protein NC651_029353 [Populus alba x Populus x berolinensis]|nr:hypothetical protein NC651_029353 [Populus alba x Populus x berolinensis]
MIGWRYFIGVFQRDRIDLMTFDVYMMLMFSHFIGSCDPLGIFQQIALNFHHPLKNMYVLIDSFGRRQSLDSVSMQKMDPFASLLPVNVKVFHTPEIKVLIFQLQ